MSNWYMKFYDMQTFSSQKDFSVGSMCRQDDLLIHSTGTRDSVDSPDRMHTESLLRSGGYLNRTLGDTTSEISEQRRPESATLNTQQLLARTIDSQVILLVFVVCL